MHPQCCPRMTNIHTFPRKDVLSPDDLRDAAEAFDEALRALPESAHDLKPYTARQLVARYVIDKALSGVRDLCK